MCLVQLQVLLPLLNHIYVYSVRRIYAAGASSALGSAAGTAPVISAAYFSPAPSAHVVPAAYSFANLKPLKKDTACSAVITECITIQTKGTNDLRKISGT